MLIEAILDGERFILHFFDTILSVSAFHIYDAVTLAPNNSIIRQFYQQKSSRSWNASNDSWDACVRKVVIKHGKCVVFSHNGDLVAACGGDETTQLLVVIEAATGIILITLKGHESAVDCAMFSPDDSLLVSGSKDRTVRLWDIQTGGLIRTLRMDGEIRSVGFSHDGAMFACNFGIWDGALAEPLHRFDREANSLAWSPTKAEVVLGYWHEDCIEILDASNWTYRELLPAHENPIRSLAYSRDGTKIASGSYGEVIIHDAETGDALRNFSTGDVKSVCFSRDRDKIVIANRNTMIIGDLANPAYVAKFKRPNPTNSVSISPDGDYIALGAVDELSIWQMHGPVQSTPMKDFQVGRVRCVVISPDLSFVASAGSTDKTVKLWESSTGACIKALIGHSRHVCCLAISTDSSLVAAGSNNKVIHVWRVADRTVVCTLRGHKNSVTDITFSPEGQRIASVSSDGELRLWEIEGGKTIEILAKTGFGEFDRPRVSISGDGSGITLQNRLKSRSWKIVSSVVSCSDGPPNICTALIPQDKTFENLSPPLYRYPENSEWILDRYNRHVFWLPADLRGCGHCEGSRVAIGSHSGRVFWFDFGHRD
jgi:WD40 repeat protein